MEIRTYTQGSIIFREGEESDCAYIIRSGRVEIFKRTERGTVLLAELGEGEIFGEMGVIDHSPRSAYASASADTEVLVISRDRLAELVSGLPEELVLITRALMERLRETNAALSRMVSKQSQFVLDTGQPPAVNRIMIFPLTSALKSRMPANGITISSLPYRVGSLPDGAEPNPLDWNNLFIHGANPDIMSRNHFAIQRGEQGLYIMDRGSKSGTIVNGTRIGAGAADHKANLHAGDNEVIAGDEQSPYRFSISWE